MKKLLCLLLSVLVLLGLVTGCKNNETSSGVDAPKTEDFVKPETYASVILVTINPQFRLYISSDDKVLAVEPVNDDAKSISNEIKFEGKKVEAVVENLITVSADNGFVKENAQINFTVEEVKDTSIATDITLFEHIPSRLSYRTEAPTIAKATSLSSTRDTDKHRINSTTSSQRRTP